MDELPLACAAAMQQGKHHCVCAHQPGAIVIECVGRMDGLLTTPAVTHLNSGRSLCVLLVAGTIRPVSVLSESVDREINDVRLALSQLLIADADSLGNALPESTQYDIGGIHKPVKYLKTIGIGDV